MNYQGFQLELKSYVILFLSHIAFITHHTALACGRGLIIKRIKYINELKIDLDWFLIKQDWWLG